MGLFSFLPWFRPPKAASHQKQQESYVPSMEEELYCQIELLPAENKAYVEQQLRKIHDAVGEAKSHYGFNDIYIRGPHPLTTASREIRVDALVLDLQRWQFR